MVLRAYSNRLFGRRARTLTPGHCARARSRTARRCRTSWTMSLVCSRHLDAASSHSTTGLLAEVLTRLTLTLTKLLWYVNFCTYADENTFQLQTVQIEEMDPDHPNNTKIEGKSISLIFNIQHTLLVCSAKRQN